MGSSRHGRGKSLLLHIKQVEGTNSDQPGLDNENKYPWEGFGPDQGSTDSCYILENGVPRRLFHQIPTEEGSSGEITENVVEG